MDEKKIREAIEELKKYQRYVGKTVYNQISMRFGSGYKEDIIDKIIINKRGVFLFFETGLMKNIDCIGNSLFLSKEEAWNRRVEE